MYRIVLEVVRVPEKCAANYKVGDKIVIEDPKILSRRSTDICLYALSTLIPYLTPLSRETSEEDWMSRVSELSCQDSGVKFKVTRTKIDSH